ncbi:choice-of-anchor Q domain-containing protein [Chloroflexus aurantiacus]
MCPITNQRGVTRPQDGTCDIGAYELQVQRVHLPLVVKQS